MFLRHVVIQRNALCCQLLSDYVLVDGAQVRGRIIEICGLSGWLRISCHKHTGIRLIQFELRRLRRAPQWRFRFGDAVGFQCNARVNKPEKILLVAIVPGTGADGGDGESAVAINQLGGELVEDLLHLQCTIACVLRDIVAILSVQLVLYRAHGRQIAFGVQETLHDFRHTADYQIGAEVRHHRIVNVLIDWRGRLAGFSDAFKCRLLYADGPTEFLEIHGTHGFFDDRANGVGAYALELGAKHGAGEYVIETAVSHQKLDHGHHVRCFLHLVDENQCIAGDERRR